ncbi:hypothetical protein AC579_3504 [Pseudocercospora musae]|uniref:Uncharacterized protein n=1 Tax=Pseudocercospora musae TaxID=113226 RepID=A0A139I3U2_9PEZI|nr:hypothetical protein AC579_3504 [Pseudocercospora musae]
MDDKTGPKLNTTAEGNQRPPDLCSAGLFRNASRLTCSQISIPISSARQITSMLLTKTEDYTPRYLVTERRASSAYV